MVSTLNKFNKIWLAQLCLQIWASVNSPDESDILYMKKESVYEAKCGNTLNELKLYNLTSLRTIYQSIVHDIAQTSQKYGKLRIRTMTSLFEAFEKPFWTSKTQSCIQHKQICSNFSRTYNFVRRYCKIVE